ncbi:hypothetical protein J5N97_027148 [Dioscorea zingiberensis]|uniref:Uncharacterized protein n=1 Tax=Dioscorea zingiberensis TaxID=325984 RepID=A0A9D5C486_9LILI|nr:hypothetical protein J5N97_027148 [Dioscorea zingiberensis]
MAFLIGVRIVSYGVVGAAAILTHETTKAYKEKLYQWALGKLRRSSPEHEIPSRPSDGSVHHCDVETTDQHLDGDSILHVQQQQQLITVDDVYQDQTVETEEEAKQSQGTPVYQVHVVEIEEEAKQSQGKPVYQEYVVETEAKQSQGTPVYQDDVVDTEAKQSQGTPVNYQDHVVETVAKQSQGHVMETKAKQGQGTVPIYQDHANLETEAGGAKQSGEGAPDQAPPPLAGRGGFFQKAFDAAKLWARGLFDWVYGLCEGKEGAAVRTVIKRISRRIFWLASDAVFLQIFKHDKALLQTYRIVASELKALGIWFT